MAQIAISPAKMTKIIITKSPSGSSDHQLPRKTFKSIRISSAKMTVFSPFYSCFRDDLITKTPTKNRQITITTATQNHQITNFFRFQSPNHQQKNCQITITTTSQDHQITIFFMYKSPNHQQKTS